MRKSLLVPLLVAVHFVLTIDFIADDAQAADPKGASVVEFYGYKDCIRLENDKTKVTLCPRAGGRVLEYALGGVNALYLPPGDEGWEIGAAGRGCSGRR
jgi:hypothetical protein